MSNDVSTARQEYSKALPAWDLVEDAVAGDQAVKNKRETYLPKPNPLDKSKENDTRYDQYLQRAVYYNATGRTLGGLVGLAFGKFPEISLPSALEFLKDDVSGTGIGLIQHANGTLSSIMKSGRAGLLVDYPTTDSNISAAQQEQLRIRPTITLYSARNIVNWRTERLNGQTILTMVVLREKNEKIDGYKIECEDQYRKLSLEDGLYTVEVFRKGAGASGWNVEERYEPKQGTGARWTEIPFAFIGAADNDVGIDPAPLYDLAVLNIAHYRNSADFEESAFFVGQPQVWMSGLDEGWVKLLNEQGIYFGSRAILPLPLNGQAGLIQAQPNTLAREAMQDKEKMMAAIGARLIMSGSAAKTATQQDSEDTVAHSVLSLACDNVSAAYKRALAWVANFARVTGELEFSIPTDFTKRTVDVTELQTLLQYVQAGKLPESELWSRLRQVGIISSDKSDDDLREEIAAQDPVGQTGLEEDENGGGDGGDPTAE